MATNPALSTFIPPEHLPQAEQCLQRCLSMEPLTAGWSPWFVKDGVTVHYQDGENNSSLLNGSCLIPASMSTIFTQFIDIKKASIFNPKLESAKVCKVYSPHAFTKLLVNSKIFPISQRYFLDFSFWTILPDGRIGFFTFTPENLEYEQSLGSMVRGTMHHMCMIIEPKGEQGCLLSMNLQISLNGSIMRYVANEGLKNLPMGLAHIRDHIQDSKIENNINHNTSLEQYVEIANSFLNE